MQFTGYDDNFIYISATSKEAAAVGGQFLKSKKAYRVPISVEAFNELKKYTDINPIKDVYDAAKSNYERLIAFKSEEDTVGSESLRPYQRVDVRFLSQVDSSAVFNEQRTGKTPTILTAVIPKLGQGIVVSPASLKINWQMEYQRWVDDEPTEVVSGSKTRRLKIYKAFKEEKVKMLFISYETLRADIEDILSIISRVDVLIADEAHRLRNYQSKQSQALYRLRRIAQNVYPMTGTPAVNHPSDVFGILKLLNPDKFTSYWQFIERYFGYTEGYFGKELLGLRKDREKEFKEILEIHSVQRKRRDVMSWIPKVLERSIPIELNPIQYRHLKTIEREFMVGDMAIPNVIAQITRMRQVSLDPALLSLEGQSAKTEFIKQYLEDNDEKIIIFSSFTSYLKRLQEVIPNSVLLTGEQSQKDKQEAVNAMQFGDARVLLANIIVGGTGWTLDNIDTIIFTDKSYNPVDNEQAADRFIPTDPNKEYGAKQIITLVAKGTIENNIQALLNQKVSIIKYVNDYGYKGLVNYDEKENNNNAGVSD